MIYIAIYLRNITEAVPKFHGENLKKFKRMSKKKKNNTNVTECMDGKIQYHNDIIFPKAIYRIKLFQPKSQQDPSCKI